MKLQFLLAGIVATGLFASAPDAVAHGGFGGGGGGGGHGGGGAFHGGGGGFHGGGRFGGFHGGRFGGFHGHRRFSAMIVFSFPVSMGTRGGGIGVIRTILTTRTITHITPANIILRLRCVLGRLTREDEAPELGIFQQRYVKRHRKERII